MSAPVQMFSSLRRFTKDVADGLLELTHNGFAILGVVVACLAITLFARPDLRHVGEGKLRTWLQERQTAMLGTPVEPFAVERATASNPTDLPTEQAAVAFWLSKKYRVAPEPLAVLVAEAYELGQRNKLDPALILAIMAIESSFNPFAQSAVGAQGLMQVMTRVHTDKYEHFGGKLAAFDPVSNLRVGVKVLRECIARAGSLEGGLRHYVGAANLPSDGGYAAKVLAEHQRIRQAAGRPVQAAPQPKLAPAAPTAPALLVKEPAPLSPAADVVTTAQAASAPDTAVVN